MSGSLCRVRRFCSAAALTTLVSAPSEALEQRQRSFRAISHRPEEVEDILLDGISLPVEDSIFDDHSFPPIRENGRESEQQHSFLEIRVLHQTAVGAKETESTSRTITAGSLGGGDVVAVADNLQQSAVQQKVYLKNQLFAKTTFATLPT